MRIISAILMCMAGMQCLSQEAEVQETVTQAIEQVASVEDDREPEDDGQSQWLDRHLRQKLDLNGADPDMIDGTSGAAFRAVPTTSRTLHRSDGIAGRAGLGCGDHPAGAALCEAGR